MGATTHSYIIAARITQGHEEWETSTLVERQAIIANYLKIKDDPRMMKYQNSHSHLDLLNHHNNDSEASLASVQKEESKTHEHKEHRHHSLRKHFSHHSHGESGTDTDTDAQVKEHRHHFPHLHKREALVSHSTPDLVGAGKGIPIVHEAEVRQVMTVD